MVTPWDQGKQISAGDEEFSNGDLSSSPLATLVSAWSKLATIGLNNGRMQLLFQATKDAAIKVMFGTRWQPRVGQVVGFNLPYFSVLCLPRNQALQRFLDRAAA